MRSLLYFCPLPTCRIQPGDMLLEVGGRGTMGGVLSETIDLLKEASESIRLKIARPDMLSSVFAVEGGDEVCVCGWVWGCVCVCVCVCV